MAGENGLHGDDDMKTIIDLMVQDIGEAEGESKTKKITWQRKKHYKISQMDPKHTQR